MLQSFLKIATEASIELPALEVSILLIIMSLCLATRHQHIGLIATYIFAYRWGWKIFAGHGMPFMTAYLIFGVLTGILTVIGMMTDKHD